MNATVKPSSSTDLETRVVPHNLAAEQAVLGAILIRTDAYYYAGKLEATHFYRDAHQVLWRAIRRLIERSVVVDLVTLADTLGDGGLARCGGLAYIGRLVDGVPRSTHIEHYATIVRELAERRALLRALTEATAACYDTVDNSLGDLREAVSTVLLPALPESGAFGADAYVDSFLETYAPPETDPGEVFEESRLLTGIDNIDQRVRGGFPVGMTLVGARTSIGKTAFLTTVAHHLGVTMGRPGRFVSCEMDLYSMTGRFMAVDSGLHAEALLERNGSIPFPVVLEAADALKARSKIVIDCETPTPSMLRAKCMQQRATTGLDWLAIDYVQLMLPEPEWRRQKRHEQVGQISTAVARLGKDLGIPVIVAAQLGRDAETRDEPILADLRESGNLEQDATNVYLLHRPPDGEPVVIIAKRRNGAPGRAAVQYDGPSMRFLNDSLRRWAQAAS